MKRKQNGSRQLIVVSAAAVAVGVLGVSVYAASVDGVKTDTILNVAADGATADAAELSAFAASNGSEASGTEETKPHIYIEQNPKIGPGVGLSETKMEDAEGSAQEPGKDNTQSSAEAAAGSSAPSGRESKTAASQNGQAVKQTEQSAENETDAAAFKEGNSANAAPYADGTQIGLNASWQYADFSVINSGKAVFYAAKSNRKGKIIAVNAGHGTEGGASAKTWCHPDKTPKVTGGTTKAGATKAVAVSGGMTFRDGTPEKTVTLRMAQILKDKLLAAGYDVLMLRDGADVQLDNVARTVIANNIADCHIALHWDGDGLNKTKGCFYMSVPDGLKSMEPVASHWQSHEALGDALIAGLKANGLKIWGSNPLDMDLTQTSFSTIPSVDIELGNQNSSHTDETLGQEADGLLQGIEAFFAA